MSLALRGLSCYAEKRFIPTQDFSVKEAGLSLLKIVYLSQVET